MSVQPVTDVSSVAGSEVATEPVPPVTHRSRVPGFLRRPGGVFGAAWLTFVLAASLTASLWRPYEVDEQDLANRLALPSGTHWLGTDALGRDILSRIFTAGALPLLASALMLVVAFGIGLPLALVAAERGRRIEGAISRVTETLMALPLIILLLAVIGAIGNKLYAVMAILGVLISAAVYRVLLGVAKSVRQRLYVDAARVNGVGSLRVNLLHVLPSMARVAAVQAAQLFGIGLLMVAGLAFLGFGPGEPEPSWGFMIQDASTHIYDAPWLMVPTGLILAITVVAANELADAIAGKGTDERRRPLRRRRVVASSEAPPADPRAVLEVRDLSVAVDDGPSLVTGVSFALQPGRVLGLIDEESDFWEAAETAGRFAVIPLTPADRQLADRFAGLMPAPGGLFTAGEWIETEWGPVPSAADTWAGCRLEGSRPYGWALLVEAEVEAVHTGPSPAPLIHYRGRYHELGD